MDGRPHCYFLFILIQSGPPKTERGIGANIMPAITHQPDIVKTVLPFIYIHYRKFLPAIFFHRIRNIIIYKHSREKGILFYTWMIIGLKNVRLETVMRWGLKIWSITFLGTFVYSVFHLQGSLYKVHDKLGLGHIFRWGMGQPCHRQ